MILFIYSIGYMTALIYASNNFEHRGGRDEFKKEIDEHGEGLVHVALSIYAMLWFVSLPIALVRNIIKKIKESK